MTPPDDCTRREMCAADWVRVTAVLVDPWGGRDVRVMLPRQSLRHLATTSLVVERGAGIGRHLYERFFAPALGAGRVTARAITSPITKGSLAFHRSLEFAIKPGNGEVDGAPVHLDDNGSGEHRVIMERVVR